MKHRYLEPISKNETLIIYFSKIAMLIWNTEYFATLINKDYSMKFFSISNIITVYNLF